MNNLEGIKLKEYVCYSKFSKRSLYIDHSVQYGTWKLTVSMSQMPKALLHTNMWVMCTRLHDCKYKRLSSWFTDITSWMIVCKLYAALSKGSFLAKHGLQATCLWLRTFWCLHVPRSIIFCCHVGSVAGKGTFKQGQNTKQCRLGIAWNQCFLALPQLLQKTDIPVTFVYCMLREDRDAKAPGLPQLAGKGPAHSPKPHTCDHPKNGKTAWPHGSHIQSKYSCQR